MKKTKFLAMVAVSFGLLGGPVLVTAAPVVIAGYNIETFATGIGAMSGMVMGSDGNLYVADNAGGRVLRVAADGSVTVVATGIANANGVARTVNGRLFTASGGNQAVYEVTSGSASLFVGAGLSFPTSVAALGNTLYVSNSGNGTISRIELNGSVTQVLSGFSSGNGPYGISFDPSGNMNFLNHSNGAVYEYDFVNSPQLLANVSSFGGTFTASGFAGQLFVTDVVLGDLMLLDGVGGTSVFASGFSAKFNPPAIGPNGIAYDGAAMYVGDGNTIYRITSVPEPATLLLLSLGLAGVGSMRHKRVSDSLKDKKM